MNVLLTSVGRRAYIVKYFKKAVGPGGKVFVSNSNDNSVAFKYADKSYISPLIYDKAYISFLLEICKQEHIDLLISLFDIDLPILAKNRNEFLSEGTKIIVSDEKIIEICNDKWKTYLFFKENGFNTPKTYLKLNDVLRAISKKEIEYPVIVKPRFGCGSIALSKASDEGELLFVSEYVRKKINDSYLKYESEAKEDIVIYQEMLKGQEYGADIINDLEGNFVNAVIKKKIAMRSGETDIAEIVDYPEAYELMKNIAGMTRHIANMDCDFFLVGNDVYFLELNARFGGGYPFSHLGGCDLPLAIIKWTNGEAVDRRLLEANKIRGFKEIDIVEG